MGNPILLREQTLSAFTITVASLASSTTGVGRQSTLIDNSTNRWPIIAVTYSIKLGTSPTANRNLYLHAIRSDKNTTAIRDDGAGASDAAWTRKNADWLYTPSGKPSIVNIGSAATGDIFSGLYYIYDPGPEWGIGLWHDTGVALDATAGNHVISWRGLDPEIQ